MTECGVSRDPLVFERGSCTLSVRDRIALLVGPLQSGHERIDLFAEPRLERVDGLAPSDERANGVAITVRRGGPAVAVVVSGGHSSDSGTNGP